MRKLINNSVSHVPILILLFVSMCALFPYLGKDYIIGTGEAAFLIDPAYLKVFNIWNDRLNFGVLSGFQANIVLFGLVWPVLKVINFAGSPSIIFVFGSLFLPGLSFYILLNSILRLKNKMLYLPGSLLYSFNIFRLSVSYMNINLNILLMFLPLFFLFYFRLINEAHKLKNFCFCCCCLFLLLLQAGIWQYLQFLIC